MNNTTNTSTLEIKKEFNVGIGIHERACLNCTKMHHKCDKRFPSCSSCLKKNIECKINTSIKKRGRPFNTTKKDLYERKRKLEMELKLKKGKQINKKIKQIKKEKKIESISSPNSVKSSPIKTFIPSIPISMPKKEIKKEFPFTMNSQVDNNTYLKEMDFKDNLNEIKWDFNLIIDSPFDIDLTSHLSEPSIDVDSLLLLPDGELSFF
eukprot:TRINITY_DN9_c0_g1_i1.p1 TRINITY_DN9_c0_g1~~TRINITY_DN9_c0_g1_i1.p1  ORF type:complete len:223 (+),score=69.33 TRINITY_DN9_c0_g1_i1:47-670(+)